MQSVKPSAELITADNPYKKVELAGRICYKSEANITDDSCVKFVSKMLGNNHLAMLEHGVIHLKVVSDIADILDDLTIDPLTYKFLTYTRPDECPSGYLTGSLRGLKEFFDELKHNNMFDHQTSLDYLLNFLRKTYPEVFNDGVNTSITDNKFVVELSDAKFIEDIHSVVNNMPFTLDEKEEIFESIVTEHIHHTIKFVCDRGVSHELVRHRLCSFAQESTRYCNYSKDKFGSEITCIDPFFFDEPGKESLKLSWVNAMQSAEKEYLYMIKNGATPQEARTVLPNSLKTEIVVTASEREWQHIVDLRYIGVTGAPHPQMKEVMAYAVPILEEISDGRISGEV